VLRTPLFVSAAVSMAHRSDRMLRTRTRLPVALRLSHTKSKNISVDCDHRLGRRIIAPQQDIHSPAGQVAAVGLRKTLRDMGR